MSDLPMAMGVSESPTRANSLNQGSSGTRRIKPNFFMVSDSSAGSIPSGPALCSLSNQAVLTVVVMRYSLFV